MKSFFSEAEASGPTLLDALAPAGWRAGVPPVAEFGLDADTLAAFTDQCAV